MTTLALRSRTVRVCFVTGGEAWTKAQDRIIRTHYPDYAELRRRLPSRTLSAIKHRTRALGVAKARHVWTQLEVARLKRIWASATDRPTDVDLRAAFPHLSTNQVRAKAGHIGLARLPPRPKMLNVEILDRVRQRACDEGMSMVELDILAGTKRYFQKSTRAINWGYVARAVEALGGELSPVWPDEERPGRLLSLAA